MPVYKSRGKQGDRQGRKINSAVGGQWARDQYGHRLYSVQGRGSSAMRGLNNKTVYSDNVERFKGTAKACIEYCKARRDKHYVIVALVVNGRRT